MRLQRVDEAPGRWRADPVVVRAVRGLEQLGAREAPVLDAAVARARVELAAHGGEAGDTVEMAGCLGRSERPLAL